MFDLAQTVPGVSPTDLYGQIAQWGLLGVLFVLTVYALIKRDKDLTMERAARLSDALAMRNLIEASTSATAAANVLRAEQARLLETVARNQEHLASRLESLIGAKQ